MSSEARSRMVAMLPRLRAYALSLTRSSPVEADDLVQAACEKALAGLSSFRDGTNFEAWMIRILRNLWIDGHRRRRDEVPIDPDEGGPVLVGSDGREVVEARSDLDAARSAIEALPEEQRSVLVLVCVDGLSYRDAADALGVPIGTVMSRLARARAAVAKAIGDTGQPAEQGGHNRGAVHS